MASDSLHIPSPGWKFYLAIGLLIYILFRIFSASSDSDNLEIDNHSNTEAVDSLASGAIETSSPLVLTNQEPEFPKEKESVNSNTEEQEQKPVQEEQEEHQDEHKVAEQVTAEPAPESSDYDTPESVTKPEIPEIDPDAPLPSIHEMLENSDPTNFHIDVLEEQMDIETDESRNGAWLDVEKYNLIQSCYDQLASTGRFTLAEVETYCGCMLNNWKEKSPGAPPKPGDINLSDINTVVNRCMEAVR